MAKKHIFLTYSYLFLIIVIKNAKTKLIITLYSTQFLNSCSNIFTHNFFLDEIFDGLRKKTINVRLRVVSIYIIFKVPQQHSVIKF